MKDSIGNEMPNGIVLGQGCGQERINEALAVNTFRLAAKMAILNNKTVIYDKDSKSATITESSGLSSIISHL